MSARRRCAIYTRKSSDEGLDQEFNSLDAQREACSAFIQSQAGEGWTALKTRYDDGGFSGGTMNRPALQQLLADTRAGKVDVIVTYKVDRLSRCLADFAKIVEVLDAEGASFVSVTQQFNTTSSMGRLTLNVLLSFAQFEREVTAERIRDKIAASKKKGLWMGGVVSLGYDVVDRKLIVNSGEAETVRTLFHLYRSLGTVRAVKAEADRLGLRTKARKPNNGSRAGGVPFTIGHLHKLLTNRIYLGEITHKDQSYPGEHEPIIDRAAWDAVQAQLDANARSRARGTNEKSPGLLTGLLYDEDGGRISPHHSTKQGRRYHYYVSRDPDARMGWRLPAKAIERAVLDGIAGLLGDTRRLIDALGPAATPAQEIEATLLRACQLRKDLQAAGPADQRAMLLDLVARIEVAQHRVRIVLRMRVLRDRLGISEPEQPAPGSATMNLDLPVTFKRRGVETKLIIAGAEATSAAPDTALIAAVTSANRWFAELKTGAAHSIKDLAARHKVDKGDISRILPLAFLAPDIVAAILDGRQPVELTAYRLKRLRALPRLWSEQRRLLGFA
ncbi:MAG: resolvase [Alphaproteobacteria bacterium]|nr:resolvase [Alphaproteobacteria bacterium]